jgi:hypothetical protein
VSRLLPVLFLPAGALAQSTSAPVKIEQGIGDVDPARTSLRRMQTDLRAPTGFESVYKFDRTDAFGNVQRSFMRIDGATYAVFPRSSYVDTSVGSLAAIPAGTTFYIGGLPDARTRQVARTSPPTLVRLALDTRLTMKPDASAPSALDRDDAKHASRDIEAAARLQDHARTRTIYEDEGARQKRLRDLLDQAPSPRAR